MINCMISNRITQTACMVLFGASMAQSPLMAGEWETLFNGNGTEAFRGYQMDSFPSDGWTVKDGSLRTNPEGTVKDIVTKKQYRNFELVFEWKATPGANSGVM